MNEENARTGSLPRATCVVLAMMTIYGFVSAARAADRPNIILIYTDDQAPNMTGSIL